MSEWKSNHELELIERVAVLEEAIAKQRMVNESLLSWLVKCDKMDRLSEALREALK